MSPISSVIEYFFLLSMPLFFVLAVILWFIRSDHLKTNRVLSVITLFCIVDAWFYSVYLPNPDIAYRYPFLHGFDSTSMCLILPGFYFYIRSLFNKVMREKIKLWPHLILFCVVFLMHGVYSFSNPDAKTIILDIFYGSQAHIFNDLPKLHQVLTVVDTLIFWLMLLVYSILSYRLRKRYLAAIGDIFSDTEKLKLTWVNSIIYLFYFLFVFYTLVLIVPFFVSPEHSLLYLNIHLGVIGFIYLYVLVQGAIHPFTYTSHILAEAKQYHESLRSGQYKSSALTAERVADIKEELLELMAQERPYLRSDLNVNQLAKMLELSSSRELSQVLSQSLQQNFNQFINLYRAQAAKEYLDAHPGSKTMLALSLDVGFNSLTSFYNYFKQLTGVAPKQYEKQLLSGR